MPAKSLAQHNFMAMSRSPKGRAALKRYGKKPAPAAVGKEFTEADRGKHFKLKRVKAHD